MKCFCLIHPQDIRNIEDIENKNNKVFLFDTFSRY